MAGRFSRLLHLAASHARPGCALTGGPSRASSAPTPCTALWTALALLVVATAASMIGFKLFFMPLALFAWLCMIRGSHWGGWTSGYKVAREIYLHRSEELERS